MGLWCLLEKLSAKEGEAFVDTQFDLKKKIKCDGGKLLLKS